MKNTRIKIGVIFGGRSTEHEVSVISALQAAANLDTDKYEPVYIYISRQGDFYVGEDIGNIEAFSDVKKLLSKSQKVILVQNNGRVDIVKYPFKMFGNNVYDYIDIAFPVVHGTNVEDGTLQGFLKTLDIPFVGPDVLGSAIGMDKYVMKTVLKYANIPVLDCLVFENYEYMANGEKTVENIEKTIGYPVIVKPINLGSSIGIKIGRDKEGLITALDYAFQFATKVLVEKAIVNLKEINCSVIGDSEEAEASECEEPVAKDEILSYEDKYVAGSKSQNKSSGMSSLQRKLPADIDDETRTTIRDMAVKAFKALNENGVSRIDFITDYKTGEIWVNEINTIPGSLSFYLWEPLGVEYKELLNRIIEIAFKRYREEKSITYSFETSILKNMKMGGLKGGKLKKLGN